MNKMVLHDQHNNGGGSCGYFKWHETSGCERCDELVRHTRRLTKKVKDLETDVEKRKLKERIINLMLFMAIVAVIYQWLWKSNLDEIDMPNAGNDLNLVRESGIPESRTILEPLQCRFRAFRRHTLVHVPIPSSSNYVLPRKILGGSLNFVKCEPN